MSPERLLALAGLVTALRLLTRRGSLALTWSTVSSSTNQISYDPGSVGTVSVPGLPRAVL